jgi:acetone carboxylase gamma subunit
LSIEQKNISDFTDEDDLIGLIYNNVNKMPISDIAKSGWMNDIDFLSETVSGLREVQHNFIEYSDIVDRQKDLEVPFRGYGI